MVGVNKVDPWRVTRSNEDGDMGSELGYGRPGLPHVYLILRNPQSLTTKFRVWTKRIQHTGTRSVKGNDPESKG